MPEFTTRPTIMGTRGVVTSGHYLATAAGFRIMEQGGNAIDAAATMCFCLNLLEPQSNGIGGEVPTLIYSAKERRVFAISGMGWSPKDFTIEWCRQNGVDLIPGDGYLPATVPAVVGTWAIAVSRFGTMSFSQILQPVIELAENGYPVYQRMHDRLEQFSESFLSLYPTTAAIYLPDGRVPEVGQIIRNPDFATSMKIMRDAEESAKSQGRVAGIEAARDAFYKGPIAKRIAEFIRANPVMDVSGEAHTGLLSEEDMAEWEATVEQIDMAMVNGPGPRWAFMGPCMTFHVGGGEGGMAFNALVPAQRANSITAIRVPPGHDAEAVRDLARERFQVALGGGLEQLKGDVFRIGHMGDLNEPMILGALGGIEAALQCLHIPHGRGGVTAAIDYLAAG